MKVKKGVNMCPEKMPLEAGMKVKKSVNICSEKLPLEAAMDEVGFGLYGALLTSLSALTMLAFACVAYSSTFLVTTSACELASTPSQQGILAAGPTAGLMLGGMIWSYLADTRGRRTMLIISLTGGAIFNTIGTFSVNWVMLLFFQFLGSLFSSGLYSMTMSLLSESVPMVNRNIVILIVASFLLLGQGFMALLAIPIIPLRFSYYIPALGIYWNSWRTLMLMFSLPNAISACSFYFMQESPKFVFTKGDENKTLEILQRIYRVNHWRVSEELQVKCLLKDEVSVIKGSTSAKDLLSLFRMPLLKNIIIMIFLYTAQQITAFGVWLPKIADQFVRIVQTGDHANLTMCQVFKVESKLISIDAAPCSLNETSLLVVLAIGVVQAIFNSCIGIVIKFVSRRNVTIILFFVGGMSGICVNFVSNTIGSAVLFTFMFLGGVVFGLCTSICVELFPTHLRTLTIALSMTAQYLGTVASIQILNLLILSDCNAGFYLFGSLFASAAIVTTFLPNDLQSTATEQEIIDAENLMEKPRRES